jgi:glycosyltransferase involved in cell wall biosynthesis
LDSHQEAPQPRMLIALPVFNAAAELTDAIRTALDQGDDIEVHVFDNASTDDTVEVARGLIPAERVHVASANAGAVANFERAFVGTRSTRFLWLAHDDRLDPGFVAAGERALDASPRASLAVPTVLFVNGEGEVLLHRPPRPGLNSRIPYRRLLAFADQLGWMEIYGVHRRDRLMAALPLQDSYGFDVLLTWRLLLRGRFCLAPDAVLRYRIHPGKTVDSSTDDNAAPGQRQPVRRPMGGIWWRLWQASGEPPISRSTRWAARLVLLTLPLRSTGRAHLRTDAAYVRARKEARAKRR